MIRVGPPLRALDMYKKYEAAYYERRKTMKSGLRVATR